MGGIRHMNITLLNYAVPEPDEKREGLRWWHKSGSRWPATILNRGNDGQAYFPWPFLLSYLTSMLKADGHNPTMLDGCLLKWSPDEVVRQVKQSAPDFIVFETSEQTEHSDPLVLERIKDLAPIILIGPNVTKDRVDLLDWPGCRALVPGEYLQSVVEFFRNPVPGVAAAHEVVGTAQMDALPFAYRDANHFTRYSARFKTTPAGPQGQFVSMWGCQYRCKFCIWIHSYWPTTNQIQKQFSIPRLEAELDHMLRAFPAVTSLYDDSDNHFYRETDAYEFAEMMGRKRLPWAILSRADTYMKQKAINRDLWKAYRANGCYAVKIGVEGTQEVMDSTDKHLSEEVVREFVPFMQDLGISVYCSFMLGVPNTAPEADRKTLQLIEDLAGYRPALFEYFISECDITQTTPFYQEVQSATYAHDGQAQFERRVERSPIPRSFGGVSPNNLE
jgi:radical SAM superfamily enzyme YgiQ (UPF0313 family)